jgi:hypothetical protein
LTQANSATPPGDRSGATPSSEATNTAAGASVALTTATGSRGASIAVNTATGSIGAAGTTTAGLSEQPGSKLSTGAKAGIGVGVALAVIALAVGLLYLLMRTRSSGKPTEQRGVTKQHEDMTTPAYRSNAQDTELPTGVEATYVHELAIESERNSKQQ